MFYECRSLKNIDISSFKITSTIDTDYMFKGCSNLITIYNNDDWSIKGIPGVDMFSECTKLVGAISYNGGKTNINYANPTTGYFTPTP